MSDETRVSLARGWRTADATVRRSIPQCGGVYAMYWDGALRYIGSTENLRARIMNHNIKLSYAPSERLTPWGCVEGFSLKVRPSRYYGDWATLELRIIRRLKPSANIRGKETAWRVA